jgi:BirA family biotin operon repressor/biotin-[acetyl-CoA-carboxylase] ligase
LETVDSTNEEAKRWLAGLYDSPLETRLCRVIAAHQQTKGKGTQGRQWLSNNPENLYCSWVHRASGDLFIPTTTDFTRVAAVAVASVLKERYQLPVFIKPINDIYAPIPNNPSQYGKLGGILVESVVQGGQIIGLITGLGLNRVLVNDPHNVVTVPTVSLSELLPEGMALPEKEELIIAITDALEPLYQRIFSGHSLPLEQLLGEYSLPFATQPF